MKLSKDGQVLRIYYACVCGVLMLADGYRCFSPRPQCAECKGKVTK